jgi:hypothetical protein
MSVWRQSSRSAIYYMCVPRSATVPQCTDSDKAYRKERAASLPELVEDLETVTPEVLLMWIEAVGECT